MCNDSLAATELSPIQRILKHRPESPVKSFCVEGLLNRNAHHHQTSADSLYIFGEGFHHSPFRFIPIYIYTYTYYIYIYIHCFSLENDLHFWCFFHIFLYVFWGTLEEVSSYCLMGSPFRNPTV